MPRKKRQSDGFPKRLKQTRKDRGLSGEALAQKVGLAGRSSISGMETGKQGADLRTTEDLATALGVRPAWLAYGDGGPTED